MKLVQFLSPALAAALCAACGANSRESAEPDQTAAQAEAARHDAREAREEATEARKEADKARQDARAATAAQRDAEQHAQLANQNSADAQWRAAHGGSPELQADSANMVVVVKNGLLFPPNGADLPLDAQARLDPAVPNLRAQAAHHVIVIDGYSDDSGTEAVNVQLSHQRADRVAEYLMARGVPRDRIVVRAFGSANPVSRDVTEGARALNRRVEISIRPADR